MALSIDMRRARAQKALDDAGYRDPVDAEEEQKRKKRKKVDDIEWVPAVDSIQTTGKN